MILKDKFLSQCASDIRIKLQQLQQQDPDASLDEMVQAATFYNREQEKEAKAQERETKRQDMPRCWPPSREAHDKPQVLKGQGRRQMCNWDIGPKSVQTVTSLLK